MSARKKLKTLFTRTLTFTLALSMLISPITQAHAANDTANNSQINTSSNKKVGKSSIDDVYWSNSNQGYRMYVVNANLERISPVYDFTYIALKDIKGVGTVLTTTRFDTASSPDESYSLYIDHLNQWTGSSDSIPEPTVLIDGVRKPNGEAFKQWFFNGKAGNKIGDYTYDDEGNIIPVSKPTDTDGDGIPDYLDLDDDNDGVPDESDPASKDPSIKGTGGLGDGFTDINGDGLCDECGNPKSNCTCPPPTETLDSDEICDGCDNPKSDCTCDNDPEEDKTILEDKNILDDPKELEALRKQSGLETLQKIPKSEDPNVQMYIDGILDACGFFWGRIPFGSDKGAVEASYIGMVNSLKKSIMATTDTEEQCRLYDECLDVVSARNIILDCLGGAKSSSINSFDLLTQNIPLADDEKKPVENLVDQPDTIKVYGTNAYGKPYKSAGDAIAEGGFLIVENITWLKLYQGGTWNNSKNYTSTMVYGTIWNLVQESSDQGWGNWSTIFPGQQIPALATSNQITTKTGKTVLPITSMGSSPTVKQVKAWYNNGYGLSMHIYDANMIFNNSDSDSDTSTYDESQEDNPAPAPDESWKIDNVEDITEEKQRTANIVKFYKDSDNGTITWQSFTRERTPVTIKIESEPYFVVKDWFTDDTFKQANGTGIKYDDYKAELWDGGSSISGTQPKTITVPEGDTTLYVLLVKSNVSANADFVLEQSEISKPMNTDRGEIKIPIAIDSLEDSCKGHCNHNFNDNCGGYKCTHSCGDACKDSCIHGNCTGCVAVGCTHSTSCTGIGKDRNGNEYHLSCWKQTCTFRLDDTSLAFKFKNKLTDTSKVIATTSGFGVRSVETQYVTRDTLKADFFEVSGYDFSFIAYRGADSLNYAKYIKDINVLGFSSASSKTVKTRESSNYNGNITVKLEDNGSDLITTSKATNSACNDTDTARTPSPFLNFKIDVLVKTYSGTTRTPDNSINSNRIITLGTSGDTKITGSMVLSGATIKFNPYIQMTYAGYDNVKHNVAVLSEYRREIIPNDYAELTWTRKDGNLLIQSQMWSTDANHTSPTDNKEWTGINQVLKGGASYQLTNNNNAQQVTVTTYQTIVEGNARNISEITGSVELTESQAKDYHKEFVNSVKSTLDNAQLVQYVSEDINGEFAWVNGIVVDRNADISDLNNGSSKASKESKYYLDTDKNNEANAQRNDLDVYEKGTTYSKYRFYSDVEGKIYMEYTVEIGTADEKTETVKLLERSQVLADVTNGIAKNIDNRTYALRKLLAVIERNTGDDYTADWSRDDGNWYNEAYEGITVYKQSTDIEVGLKVKGALNTIRTTVLDPKLIPKVTSKNNQGTTAFSMAYIVNLENDTVIGKFKGTEVFMQDPYLLFNSRNIYITNMTVDDNR